MKKPLIILLTICLILTASSEQKQKTKVWTDKEKALAENPLFAFRENTPVL